MENSSCTRKIQLYDPDGNQFDEYEQDVTYKRSYTQNIKTDKKTYGKWKLVGSPYWKEFKLKSENGWIPTIKKIPREKTRFGKNKVVKVKYKDTDEDQ